MSDFRITISSPEFEFNDDLKQTIVKVVMETTAAKTGKGFSVETDEIIDFYIPNDDDCGEEE